MGLPIHRRLYGMSLFAMEDESPELQTLKAFLSDLEPALIESVWKEQNEDYKAAMEVLAELAKKPSAAAARRGRSQGAAEPEEEPRSPLRPPLSSTVSDAPAPSYSAEQREVPSWKAEPPSEAGRDAAGAWDPWSALMDLGNSVSDGITGIADNISDFVSDLASAFDAGWDDNQEHGLGPGHVGAPDRNRAAVVAGGMDAQRASNRRHPRTAVSNQAARVDSWVGDEDDKKDA